MQASKFCNHPRVREKSVLILLMLGLRKILLLSTSAAQAKLGETS
jgi:hypothetical protein